jgi:hypothetical protein
MLGTGLVLDPFTIHTPLNEEEINKLSSVAQRLYRFIHKGMIEDFTRDKPTSYNPMYSQDMWENGLAIAASGKPDTSIAIEIIEWNGTDLYNPEDLKTVMAGWNSL